MEELRLWGAIVNALAVIGGAAIGMLFKRLIGDTSKNERAKALSDHIFFGMGLCVITIGISGAIESTNILVVIISVAIGSLLGHLMRLDAGVNALGNKIEALARDKFGNVAQGFVSASLLFCVGAMAIVGSLDSGLLCDHTTQYTKATIDFVSAIVLASSMGIGVMFSALFILVFQGSITLLAQWISPFLNTEVISCMSVVGSILIIGLAMNMLNITKLKIMNYMPAIFLPILFIPLANWIAQIL